MPESVHCGLVTAAGGHRKTQNNCLWAVALAAGIVMVIAAAKPALLAVAEQVYLPELGLREENIERRCCIGVGAFLWGRRAAKGHSNCGWPFEMFFPTSSWPSAVLPVGDPRMCGVHTKDMGGCATERASHH